MHIYRAQLKSLQVTFINLYFYSRNEMRIRAHADLGLRQMNIL